MEVMETVKKMKESVAMLRSVGAGRQEVEFTFSAPGAGQVCLAGKFNNWSTSSLPMKKGKDGIWRIKLRLPEGKHEYKYFVDNAWVQDVPGCDAVPNAFGTSNCIITVGGGAARKAA